MHITDTSKFTVMYALSDCFSDVYLMTTNKRELLLYNTHCISGDQCHLKPPAAIKHKIMNNLQYDN